MLLHGCGCQWSQWSQHPLPGILIPAVSMCKEGTQNLITVLHEEAAKTYDRQGSTSWSPVSQPCDWAALRKVSHLPFLPLLTSSLPPVHIGNTSQALECLQATLSWGGICVVKIDYQLDRSLNCGSDKPLAICDSRISSLWREDEGTLAEAFQHQHLSRFPDWIWHDQLPRALADRTPLSWQTIPLSCELNPSFLPLVAFVKYFNHWTKNSN